MEGDYHSPPGDSQCGSDCDVLADIGASVAEYLAAMDELDIVVKPSVGRLQVDLDSGRVKLGHLVLAGRGVAVYPRFGVTLQQFGELMQQAQIARLSGHDLSAGWRHVRGVGWSVAVYQSVQMSGSAVDGRCRPLLSPSRSAEQRVILSRLWPGEGSLADYQRSDRFAGGK